MRDISKKLTIINTGERKEKTSGTSTAQTASYGGGGGGVAIGGGLYLPKATWDKVFEIKSTSSGEEYLFGKLPIALQYGLTMYVDGEMIELPSLAQGLPFDGRTIWYNPDTQQIEVIGGTGGGSGEGVSNFWDLSGIPSWITNSKPKYTYTEIEGTPDLSKYALVSQIPSLSGYATESWVTKQNYATKATTLSGYGITDAYTKTNVDDLLKSYVTLAGSQTITGEKNFTGGLKVNGSPIVYDATKKYWKLEGDLLVTGGVTMYGNEGTYTPSTIMDAISVDGTTISKEGGVLKVIGGTGGGVADSVAWINITGKPTFASVATSGKYSDLTGKPTLLSSFTDDVVSGKYLPLSGGELSNSATGLFINRTTASENPHITFKSQGVAVGDIGVSTEGYPLFYNYSTLSWEQIALITNNVASATKLQIERTIWGQSFDGTGNVSGNMTGVGIVNSFLNIKQESSVSHLFLTNPTSNVDYGHIYVSNYDNSRKDRPLVLQNGYGNVGIDTPNPSCKLDVNGITQSTALKTNSLFFECDSSGNTSGRGGEINRYTGSVHLQYATNKNVILCFGGGSVGVCLETPTSKLDVYGVIRSRAYNAIGNNNASFLFDKSGSNYTGIGASGEADTIYFGACNESGAWVNYTQIWKFGGNILTTGLITMQGTSDKRLKKNIRSFNASEELMKLGGVYQFEYIDAEITRNSEYKGTHIGLIYQNVKQTSLAKMCYEREDGYGALNYLDTSFISLLAGVGMEHETRIQKLERENKELRAEIQRLKSA